MRKAVLSQKLEDPEVFLNRLVAKFRRKHFTLDVDEWHMSKFLRPEWGPAALLKLHKCLVQCWCKLN